MHKRIVASIVARIVLVVSLIMLIPLGWAFFDNSQSLEVLAFSGTILFGLLISFVVRAFCPLHEDDFEYLNAKDGLAIVGLSWIVLSFLGAMPFYFTGSVLSFTDAFFETVSGFTTTGATIITHIESLPKGLLFWRSLTHWLGGMGIIVLFLALLPAVGQGAYRLYQAEAPGPTAERAQPRIKETAKALWGVYFVLSVLETLLLKIGGMNWFDALCHTFGTMATGGFSTKTASIAAFNPFIQWVIVVFMFLAGTNFILHYQAIKGSPKTFFKSEEFRWYFFLVIFLTVVFTLVLKSSYDLSFPIRTAAFQIVSILTTTGYVTADFNLWPNVLRVSLVCLMFVGGCAGSTGGGMKVVRIFLILKTALRSVVQSLFPNAIIPVKIDKKPVSEKIILGVLSFGAIFVVLFVFGAVAMAATNRCDFQTAATASIACLGNIGPGLGKVGAIENYSWISAPGKWMLAFLMLAGRLELYSILILFVPIAWRK